MDLNVTKLRCAAKRFRKSSPRTAERFLALIELAKKAQRRDLKQLDYERVGAEFEVTSRTLMRWKKSWKQDGVKGVVPKVSPGRRKRPIRGFIAKKIVDFRKKYRWGAEVIHAHLKLDHGAVISEDRIHRFLKNKDFIENGRKRKPKSKHIKVVKVENPGTHTQNDVKHLPHMLPNSQKSYVYNFVDHASKWEMKRAYDSYGPSETKDFAQRVIKKAPFQISRWQTDNGIEFTFKFVSHVDKPRKHALDTFCKNNGIRHVLIPVGEKELQGLVERSHRMDEDELYHRIKPRSLEELNRYLEAHYEWKNSNRRRKAIGWKTPNEWLKNYDEKILSGLVRHKDPVDSVVPTPNDGLGHKEGWEKSLVEVWSHVARQNGPAAKKLLGPDQTRQNLFEENKQRKEQARSVSSSKKAA